MEKWVDSFHCKSGKHCNSCLNNKEWRKSSSKVFLEFLDENFKCPFTEEERNKRQKAAQEKKEERKVAVEAEALSKSAEQILDRKEDLNDKFSPLITKYREEISRASCGRCAKRRLRRVYLAKIKVLLENAS